MQPKYKPTDWQLAPSNTDFSVGKDKNTGNKGQSVSVTILAAESILSPAKQPIKPFSIMLSMTVGVGPIYTNSFTESSRNTLQQSYR